jgi:hypothetical protein
MLRSLVYAALATCLSLSVAACGDDDTPTSPTEPTTPITLTETFSGRLERNFAVIHTFQSDAGTVTATLTTLTPDSAALVGLDLGTWNGASCAVVITKTDATQGTTIVGQASVAGNLCLRVYDANGLSQPASYEVQVAHR